MKPLKLLFYTVLISLVTLTSCTNNDVDDLPDPQESAAMQTALTELGTLYNEDGTIISDMNPTGNLLFDFCFEFVYPIELIYNNGSTVTINSNEELIEVIINSTQDLYIVGIEFPFNVEVFNSDSNVVEIITITNESEFAALLASCLFDDPCDCDDEYEPVCVEIQENGQTIIITFPNACYAECEGFTEDQYFECDEDEDCECDDEYNPVCVETPNGGIIEFDNECEAECEGFTEDDFVDCEDDGCDCDDEYDPVCVEAGNEIIEFDNECEALCEGFTEDDFVDCEDDGCDCDDEYDPVCVVIEENGQTYTITFDNACEAECEGFTEEDFVDCENDEDCEISELEVEIGECNNDGTYSLTIDFDYENTDNQEYFDLYVRNGVLIGYYALADLPLTIENFELSGYDYDYIKVCINDNADCCQEMEWEAPECDNNNECDISELEVEVGECNPNGTYSLTIDFEYENTDGQQYFDLFVRNNEFIGYYELADLPLTIENFELSGYEYDYIKVCINDTSDCCQEMEWEAPDCDGNEDDCYEFVFPINMTSNNGGTVTVDSNEEVDYYLELDYQLVYPIDLIINNETITVSQGILEGVYGDRCD